MTIQDLQADLAKINSVIDAILKFLPAGAADTLRHTADSLKLLESNPILQTVFVAMFNHLIAQPTPTPSVTETVIPPAPAEFPPQA